MRHLAALAVLAAATLAFTGCCSSRGSSHGHGHGRIHTTPLNASGGPVNISGGPITVTGGPVTVHGTPASTAATTSASVTHVPTQAATATSSTAAVHGGHGIPGDGTHLELKTETLSVDRKTVSNGAVRIRKYVVSEPQTVSTTVRREELSIERIPASGVPTTPFGEAEAVIEVPLTTETVSAVVTPRVIERVRIHRVITNDQKDVTATLRTEKLEILKSN